ncbi:MAG: hypothetical protein IPP21_06485 [Betaproteobacteria bacterium]|nr:hypothetical protein [Betaproteobacteria bacterium]
MSWDTLNHHIYLGWVAEHMRFDKDYMATGSQAYQFPYLYWPVYKLAATGFRGVPAGIVLSTLHLVVVPPVWMISRLLIKEHGLLGVLLRSIAVMLAFMSAVPLKTLEATGNDLLAAAPVVWAVALILQAMALDMTSATKTSIYAGLLAGLGVACKFSNGPLVILLPFLFLLFKSPLIDRPKWFVLNSVATAIGFLVCFSIGATISGSPLAIRYTLSLVSVITFFFQRHGKQATAPTEGKLLWALFLLIFAAFVPWLMTTGNGRYFMPVLLLIGPVCIGLICRLPVTKGMKGAMALIVFSIQAVALAWRTTPAPIRLVVMDPG